MTRRRPSLKSRLAEGALTAACRALALLPTPALHGLANGLALVLRGPLKYRRGVIRDNLARCFPDMTPAERAAVERKYYTHLADLMVETIKLLHISDAELARRVEVRGAELVDEGAAAGRSMILLLGHYGNWEWVPRVTAHYTPAVHSCHVYKELHDAASQRLYDRIRGRFPSEGVRQEDVLRRLIGWRREGRLFLAGFISDHRANTPDVHHSLTFLGQPTPVQTGAEAVGRKLGVDFLYLDVEKTARGRYRMTFRRVEPTEAELATDWPVTRAYHRLLEATIRRAPAYWLWSHRRWLYKPS